MDAKRVFGHAFVVAALAAAAGMFSGSALAMPTPAGIDAVGRSSDWLVRHGLGVTPRLAAGRDVNGVPGRASNDAWRTGTAVRSISVQSRNIRTFGRV
jgi:hypothetical protein